MSKKIEMVTQVVSVRKVTLQGTLSYKNTGWEIDGDNISQWLDRFDDKYVKFSIETLQDESALLGIILGTDEESLR